MTPATQISAPLKRLVTASRDADLHWPAFPEFHLELGRLYERAVWQPLWLQADHPTDAALGLVARLAAADSLGLDPVDFDAAWLGNHARELGSPRQPATADELARFDLALSVAAVRFVSALHRGRVSPRAVNAQLFIPRSFLAVEMVVDSLRDVRRQGELLEHVQPRLHHYQLLKNALARYRAMALDTSLVPLPALGRAVKPGMRLPAAPQLRHLLESTGDMARARGAGPADNSIYSADLVAGVKKFQLRQGFTPDGVIGPATAERLNRPFAERVRQIELALERFRWLPVSFSAPPIIVNIPAFRLYAFRGPTDREADVLAMDVVVGSAFDRHTPVFAADMKYLIFRPYWDVPASIVDEELGPKALSDPAFFKNERFELVNGQRDDSPTLPATRANFRRIGKDVRVRQRPGPENALGLVKFLMPNVDNVYLHDTAAKGTFARARRDASHGCIRLSDPVALATQVLADQPEWTIEKVRAAMQGEDNLRVDLSHPVPVCIVYSTAFARDDGDVFFYADVYELDSELDRLLRTGYPYPK